ncbi:MAG: hypothetical protein HYV40_01430 [Candidatus Levybacteria bacterium]|nr:hypothetical protein [Candidatus Levybacteria bacterium]
MKFVLSIIFAFFLTFLTPLAVFAQDEQKLDPCAGGNSNLAMCATADLPFGPAFGLIIQFLFVIAVIVALGFLVYGGIRWITSGGDKGGVETARNTIISAIVGLILVFLAYVILNLVLLFLTGSGLSGITIPNLSGISGGGGINSCSNGQIVNIISGNPTCICDGGRSINPNTGACL